MLEKFKQIIIKIIGLNDSFDYNVEECKIYLNKLGNPPDDIDRSFYQYKCQMYLYGNFICFILNFLSVIPLLYFYIVLRTVDNNDKYNSSYAVYYSNGINSNIIPRKLVDRFKNIKNIEALNIKIIDTEGKGLIKEMVKRHFFSPYFILKNLLKIASYCELISKENCGAIICSNEYSFTSSILTNYCNRKGIEHINIMHGEKLFNIRDSFFHFNECYVWDDFYIDLFTEMKAECDKFVVGIPEIFKSDAKNYRQRKVVDFRYYLQNESKDELNGIYDLLTQLKDKGYSVSLRMHPLYSDVLVIKEIFQDSDIEDNSIDIFESIHSTNYVVAKYSTVIFQAYCNGINIAIDDVTNRGLYTKLKALEYIMIQKSIPSISEIIGVADEKQW